MSQQLPEKRICPACGCQVDMNPLRAISRTLIIEDQKVIEVFHHGCATQILKAYAEDWKKRQEQAEEQMRQDIEGN